MTSSESFDAIVIGTGFGGAIAACRLAQAGLRLCVIERGRRYTEDDFLVADSDDGLAPDLVHLAWAGDRGIWDLRRAGDIDVGQAAGYGGGSLIYANVHLRAPDDVFASGWPAGYSRPALDPYYDLVAHKLGVCSSRHVVPGGCAKGEGFARAARQLGREGDLFDAPVAVRGRGGPTDAATAGYCEGCGGCDVGCRYGAKNTLDRTYLADAERETDADGQPLADVRTMCEARLIRPLEEHGRPGYAVEYTDHLLGGARRTVTAPRVFLCAGALNTMELLLRSRPHLPGLSNGVGQRVFTNCDQLGVVFDAREPHEPTRGPVITKGLAHREENGARVILQEGGFPYALRGVYAAFRARALLANNRHLDTDGGYAPRGRRRPARRMGSTISPAAKEGRGDSHLAVDRAWGVAAALAAGDYRSAVPAQLAGVLRSFRESFERRATDEVADVVRRTLRRLLGARVAQAARALSRVPGVDLRPDAARAVARSFVRSFASAFRRASGLSDEAIIGAAVASIVERHGLDEPLSAFARAATRALSLDPAISDPEAYVDHGAVLLAMAADPEPSTADLDASGRLVIDVPGATKRQCASSERLMRDFSATYGGELRMTPGWSLSRRLLSVQLHGGCGMGDAPADGVTDPHGEVRGCPGLYVLDGSSLPKPVGVNPSSTIAAVAERNVEHHIRRLLRDPSWHAPEWKEARRFGVLHARDLDPIAQPARAPCAAIRAAPVGLVFRERMTGFAAAVGVVVDDPAGYERAEEAGSRLGQTMALELEYCASDIAHFVEDEHVLTVSGTLVCSLDGPRTEQTFPVRGTVAFTRRTARDRDWIWRYDLSLRTEAGHATVVGRKVLSADAEESVWRGAITLFADIALGSRRMAGILRVSLEDCLGQVLPSVLVTGTRDPARIAWGLWQFASFFGKRIWELRGRAAVWDPVLHPVASRPADAPRWRVA